MSDSRAYSIDYKQFFEQVEKDTKDYISKSYKDRTIIFDLDSFCKDYSHKSTDVSELYESVFTILRSAITSGILQGYKSEFPDYDPHSKDEDIKNKSLDILSEIDNKLILINGINGDYPIYHKSISRSFSDNLSTDELRAKYKTIAEKLNDIDKSSNKHRLKEIRSLTLYLKKINNKFKLVLSDTVNVIDYITNTQQEEYLYSKEDEMILFTFKNVSKIHDIYLNKYYYSLKEITAVIGNKIISKDIQLDSISDVLEYISTDAVKKYIKKDYSLIDVVKDVLKNAVSNISIKSSLFVLTEYDNKIIFPSVEPAPTMFRSRSLPTPSDVQKMLSTLNVKEKDKLLSYLIKFNKDHNILTEAYFIGTLLTKVINYENTPTLILYGDAKHGKTTIARYFNFTEVKTKAPTEPQIFRTCVGYGCGYNLFDEPSNFKRSICDMFKDCATAPEFKQSYGRDNETILFKTGHIITCNHPYSINFENEEDVKAFLRRSITLKVNGKTDNIPKELIKDSLDYLKNNTLELKKVFIDYLMTLNPTDLKNRYSTTIESDDQFKFIRFSLNLLKDFYKSHNISFLTSERIEQIISRLKDDGKEFETDIINDNNITDIIEEIIYNDFIKIATMQDKAPDKAVMHETMNKYSMQLFNLNKYTMFHTGNTKRLFLNQSGLNNILPKLKEKGINYPNKMKLTTFLDKLKSKGHNVDICKTRIGTDTNSVKDGLKIDIVLDYEGLKDNVDILSDIKQICIINAGNLDISVLTDSFEETRIKDTLRILESMKLLSKKDDKYSIDSESLNQLSDLIDSMSQSTIKLSKSDQVLDALKILYEINNNEPIEFDLLMEHLKDHEPEETKQILKTLEWGNIIAEQNDNKYSII